MARVRLQFWKHQGVSAGLSAAFSTFTHVVVIGAWVVVTLPAFKAAFPPSETPVWYIPPPDPKPASQGSIETIRYVEFAPDGEGSGFGAVESNGVELNIGRVDGNSRGNTGADSTSTLAEPGSDAVDSVFTIIDVDSAAARLPESAAPRYPPDLLEKRVQGQAIVQFVVDTTGLADPSTFSVILTSHPEFASAVREALPGMRFTTAKIGETKVRQLVELPFTFNISIPAPTPAESIATQAATKRRPTRRPSGR